MKKRIFALLMALCMMFSMTTVALADDTANQIPTVDFDDTDEITTTLVAEEKTGYECQIVMPSEGGDGTPLNAAYSVEFYVDEETAAANGFTFVVTNTLTGEYSEIRTAGESATVEARANDVLKVEITSTEYDWDLEDYVYFDASVVWGIATFSECEDGEVISSMNQYGEYTYWAEKRLMSGEPYYYEYEVEITGTLSIYIDEETTVDSYLEDTEYYKDNPLLVNKFSELKPEIELYKNDSENADVKYSDGTEKLVVSEGFGSSTYKVIKMDVVAGDLVTIAISSNATGYGKGVMMAWGAILQAPVGTETNPLTVMAPTANVELTSNEPYYFRFDRNIAMNMQGLSIAGEDVKLYALGMGPMTEVELDNNGNVSEENFNNVVMYASQLALVYTGQGTTECDIVCDIPLGVEVNPQVVEGNKATVEKELEDNYYGYWYSWKAPADGVVSIDIDSKTEGVGWRAAINPANATEGMILFSPENKDVVIEVSKDEVVKFQLIAAVFDEPDPEVEEINYEYLWGTTAGTIAATLEFSATTGNVVNKEHVAEVVEQIESGLVEDNTVYVNVVYDENGEIVDVLDPEATVIPGDVLAAVKEWNATATEDEIIDIVFTSEKYLWVIDGATIENTQPIDLGITFDTENTAEATIEAIAKGDDYATFSIAHTGDFGFEAVLEFVVDLEANPTYVGKTATLYWDNNGKLEQVGAKATIGADGIIGFAMDHASDYVIVFEGTAATGTTPGTADKAPVTAPVTGDSANFALWIAVLGLGVVAMAGSVVMKKREF